MTKEVTAVLMQLDKLTRILKELHEDKQAMSPPIPAGAARAAGGAAKGAGGAAKAGGAGKSGGIGDMLGGGMPGGGMPDISSMNPMNTDAGERIKEHEANIEKLKATLKKCEDAIEQAKQSIKTAQERQSQYGDELKRVQSGEQQGGPQFVQKLQEAIESAKNNEQENKQHLDGFLKTRDDIKKLISEEEAFISKMKGDVWQERKLNAASFIPEAGIAAMAGEELVKKKHDFQEQRLESKESKLGGIPDLGAGTSSPQSPSPSTPAPSMPDMPSSSSSTPSASPTGGGGGSPGRGIGGFASKLFSGGGGSGGEPQNAPIGSILGIIGALLAGAFIFRTSATTDPVQLLPALVPIGLVILLFLYLIKTRGNRGALAWIIILAIIAVAGFYFATATFPYLLAAWQSGEAARASGETQAGLSQTVAKGFEDAMTSYRRNMASATGERIEGDVDTKVKDEVGIEILPPYLPNPKQINQNEAPYLEIGARIKGYDPKTPITMGVLCHTQTRDDARNLATSVQRAGKGPRTTLGQQQEVEPTSFSDYTFDKELTCYPRLPNLACGNYVTTISAQADHLRTDAQMINYVIDDAILKEQLHEYAVSYEKELRSEGEVTAAMNQIYKGQLGSVRSVSDKGAIKVVMAASPLPLTGIGSGDSSDFKLRAGIENMKNGWVTEVNEVKIQVPGMLTPRSDRCRGWQLQEGWLKLEADYLRNANFREMTKGEQKIFPSCMLVPSGSYQFTEPTEATFLASVDYNYIVQEEYDLEVRNETGGACRNTTPMSGTSPSVQEEGQPAEPATS